MSKKKMGFLPIKFGKSFSIMKIYIKSIFAKTSLFTVGKVKINTTIFFFLFL